MPKLFASHSFAHSYLPGKFFTITTTAGAAAAAVGGAAADVSDAVYCRVASILFYYYFSFYFCLQRTHNYFIYLEYETTCINFFSFRSLFFYFKSAKPLFLLSQV